MKYILLAAWVIITAAWLFFTSINYNGLNSVQNLSNYHDGILGRSALPRPDNLTVKAAVRGAEVAIDTLGIPHIYGKDQLSVAYALGFMHARDRYFQMELTANIVMGKLSSVLGSAGIPSDRRWKRFELEQKAKDYLELLSRTQPDLYEYLRSYENGVNAYVNSEDSRHRDPLYAIWNYSPRPWKAYYTFLIQWYMSADLTLYDDYINRQEILDKLPANIRQTFYPAQPDNQPLIIPGAKPDTSLLKEHSLVKVFESDQENLYQSRPFNRSLGSNNWVIGATSTRSGQLFLCNDLHLFLAAPNIFYEAHLHCPSMHVYGYTIPGVPLVLSGHNEKIAWGLTNGGWDVTEQYLLKLDPAAPDRYWLDGKWQALVSKDFFIDVKGGKQEKMTVKYTVFGPMVRKDSLAYGLKWHPQQSCQAVLSFWKIMHASDWNSFREALRLYDYPSQNFVYGDIKKNIGMICAGKMPVKPAGYAGGLLDGSISPHWSYVPFDSLPQSFNPRQDYLFSANQEPERGKYYFSSRWFDDLYRPRRINALLSAAHSVDREDVRQMQLDVKDLSAVELRSLLEKYAGNEKLSPDWEKMRTWDGILDPNRKEAVFYKYFRHSARMISNQIAGTLKVKAAPRFDQFMHFLLCYDSVAVAGKTTYSKDYFKRIVKTTDSLFDGWNRAGSVYKPYSFNIPQMTFLPGFEINMGGIGGSENTINVNYGAHPVIRTLIEITENGIQSWMVNATGQSGRLNEAGYLQQLPAWKENDLHKTQFYADLRQLSHISGKIIFTDSIK